MQSYPLAEHISDITSMHPIYFAKTIHSACTGIWMHNLQITEVPACVNSKLLGGSIQYLTIPTIPKCYLDQFTTLTVTTLHI